MCEKGFLIRGKLWKSVWVKKRKTRRKFTKSASISKFRQKHRLPFIARILRCIKAPKSKPYHQNNINFLEFSWHRDQSLCFKVINFSFFCELHAHIKNILTHFWGVEREETVGEDYISYHLLLKASWQGLFCNVKSVLKWREFKSIIVGSPASWPLK